MRTLLCIIFLVPLSTASIAQEAKLRAQIPILTGNGIGIYDHMMHYDGKKSDPAPEHPWLLPKFPEFQQLGIQGVEINISWIGVEREENKWDWSFFDQTVADIKAHGMDINAQMWLMFPPRWVVDSGRGTLMRSVNDNEEVYNLSVWDPATLEWYVRFYKNLSAHYDGVLENVYLCITGDWGEGDYATGGAHTLIDMRTAGSRYWCNDSYAQADFRQRMMAKYGSMDALNTAWGTAFAVPDDIAFPSSPAQKRHWLDFNRWYQQSLVRFSDELYQQVKPFFSKTHIGLKPGGAAPPPLYFGQDTIGFARTFRDRNVRFQPASCDSRYFWAKWRASAYRFYHIPFSSEAGGAYAWEEDMGRLFNDIACGMDELYEFPVHLEKYKDSILAASEHMTGEKPLCDVALFYPVSESLLVDPAKNTIPDSIENLSQVSEGLHRYIDYDVVEERMILDGALQQYRIAAMLAGTVVERDVLEKLAEWVRGGGILVATDFGPISTVEGDASFSANMFSQPDTEPKTVEDILGAGFRPQGKGCTLFMKGAWDGAQDSPQKTLFCVLMRELNAHASHLGEQFQDGIDLGMVGAGDLAVLFSSHILYFNPSKDTPVKRTVQLDLASFRAHGLGTPSAATIELDLAPCGFQSVPLTDDSQTKRPK